MQPTTLCNLNCSYCYLADRKSNFTMPVEIAHAVASNFKVIDTPITVIWHGGEPLATGPAHFERLLEAFNGTQVCHAIQTNATLIDDEWCELFKKYAVNIGISLDGPASINANRVDFGGKETLSKVEKGASLLRKHGIKFGVISVINDLNINNAHDLFDYCIELGAHSLAINIEEIDGINTRPVPDNESVTAFWKDLWDAWTNKPMIRIREFDRIGRWLTSSVANRSSDENRIDLFPTIAWNGDVVLFSPELHSFKAKADDFVIGNVSSTSLFKLMRDMFSDRLNYAYEYLEGVEMCKVDCPYFQYCKGGHASNKYAEHHKLNVTETIACRNSRKRLINAIIESTADPKNSYELNSLIKERVGMSKSLKSLISDRLENIVSSKSASGYDKFDDFNKWDDFDKIIFAEYDDDGNETGITIGGH
jgi:uncharacterized protein